MFSLLNQTLSCSCTFTHVVVVVMFFFFSYTSTEPHLRAFLASFHSSQSNNILSLMEGATTVPPTLIIVHDLLGIVGDKVRLVTIKYNTSYNLNLYRAFAVIKLIKLTTFYTMSTIARTMAMLTDAVRFVNKTATADATRSAIYLFKPRFANSQFAHKYSKSIWLN